MAAAEGIELTWVQLDEGSPLVGQSLAGADLRARTGASVIALMRGGRLQANPKSQTVFEAGDRVGLIGTEEQVEAARREIGEIEEMRKIGEKGDSGSEKPLPRISPN